MIDDQLNAGQFTHWRWAGQRGGRARGKATGDSVSSVNLSPSRPTLWARQRIAGSEASFARRCPRDGGVPRASGAAANGLAEFRVLFRGQRLDEFLEVGPDFVLIPPRFSPGTELGLVDPLAQFRRQVGHVPFRLQELIEEKPGEGGSCSVYGVPIVGLSCKGPEVRICTLMDQGTRPALITDSCLDRSVPPMDLHAAKITHPQNGSRTARRGGGRCAMRVPRRGPPTGRTRRAR